MSEKVKIDEGRCIRCGKCETVCPTRIFGPADGAVPKLVEEMVPECIECGHCVTICPAGAIVAGKVTPENSQKNRPERLPTFEQFAELVRYRRSIRHFKPDRVREEDIDRLFELIRWAPTAKNRLPLHWVVINDFDEVHRLAGIIVESLRGSGKMEGMVAAWDAGYDWIHRGAPCLMFAWTDSENAEWNPFDSSIAAETADLAAPLLGLGSCWAGFFILAAAQFPPLRRELGLPSEARVGGALMLGYPDGENYSRTPFRPACQVERRKF